MSTDTDKQLARRIYDEVLNKRNLAALDEMVKSDYIEHDPLPGQGTGLQGIKDRFRMLLDALGVRFKLEDVVAEGDRVVVRWINTGRHVGEFLGIPPSGRSFSIPGIDIYRVEDGKLAEHWHVVDNLAMLQQLGVIPSPEPVSA